MGKGVLADSHPLNAASARSAALLGADVVLVLGARLNWILHYGESPKWGPNVKIIQVDISAEELGRNNGDATLGIVGDINIVTTQLHAALGEWKYNTSSEFIRSLKASAARNEEKARKSAEVSKIPMTYAQTFDIIKNTLHKLSPPDEGNIVYVSEGANTMDISRSIFPVHHPRLRLDAGTYATMVSIIFILNCCCSLYKLQSQERF
jgi:2-hydroxyacyl-CoA lyase 1